MYVCKLCIIVLPSTVQYFPIRVTALAICMFPNRLSLKMYRYKRRVLEKRRRNFLKTAITISVQSSTDLRFLPYSTGQYIQEHKNRPHYVTRRNEIESHFVRTANEDGNNTATVL